MTSANDPLLDAICRASADDVLMIAALLAQQLQEKSTLSDPPVDEDLAVTSLYDLAEPISKDDEANASLVASTRTALLALGDHATTRKVLAFTVFQLMDGRPRQFGWGSDVSRVVLAAGLSVALVLAVSKSRLDVDLGPVQFGIDAGVPEGIEALVDGLASVVDASVSGATTRSPSASPSSEDAPDSSVKGSTKEGQKGVKGAADASPAVHGTSAGQPSLEKLEALQIRDDLWRTIHGNDCPPHLNDQEIWKTASSNKLRALWSDSKAYRVGLGLFPVESDGKRRYRFAVRIQSPFEIRSPAWKDIPAFFKDRTNQLASARRIGEVFHLSNGTVLREQQSGRWSGPFQRAIGASVSPISPFRGALSCFVESDQEPNSALALIAGHVATQNGRFGIGTPIYCPATDDPQPSPSTLLGQIETFKLPKYSASDVLEGTLSPIERLNGSFDAALVRISTELPANPGLMRDIGDLRGVNRHLDDASMAGDEPMSVVKVPARSQRREGIVSAEEMLTLVTTADLQPIVYDGLMEFTSTDGKPFATDGDSGALTTDSQRLAVAGIVGGTSFGEIMESRGGCAYGQRLDRVLDVFGLTVVLDHGN
jgi:hypothetical protein